MPFSFTDPLGGLFGGALEGIGGFLGDVIDVGSGLFEAASPVLGGLNQLGVIGGGGPSGGSSRPTSPATPQAMQASMLPIAIGAGRAAAPSIGRVLGLAGAGAAVGDALDVFEGIGSVFGGDSGMSSLTINPVTSGAVRYPRTVQQLVRTPSGNTRVVTYRNMGSPVLYSGDLAAKKRVNKVRRRLGR